MLALRRLGQKVIKDNKRTFSNGDVSKGNYTKNNMKAAGPLEEKSMHRKNSTFVKRSRRKFKN